MRKIIKYKLAEKAIDALLLLDRTTPDFNWKVNCELERFEFEMELENKAPISKPKPQSVPKRGNGRGETSEAAAKEFDAGRRQVPSKSRRKTINYTDKALTYSGGFAPIGI